MGKNGPVLVYIELGNEKNILPISLECLIGGKKLAAELGCTLSAVVIGHNVSDAAMEISAFGAKEVLVVDDALLDEYKPETYVAVFNQITEKADPRAILMGQTLISIDLAPRVAFSIDTGLVTDCVDIESSEGELQFIKPVYSGNVMAAYNLTTEPYMATIRTGSFEPAEKGEADGDKIKSLPVEIDTGVIKTEVLKREIEAGEGPALTGAEIIVSGGRGIGGAEGFEQLSELAQMLNAALGASRPPCDLAWVSPKVQVGQTGEIVRPLVYIAVGISGATQHLTGMSGAKTIVAINKDQEANIFKIADYGVVGKFEEVLPAFTDKIKEVLK